MLRSFFALILASFFCTIPSEASPIFDTNPFASADPYGLSPYWDWKTIESEHFRLTFPTELSSVGKRTIQFLEEAHQILSPVLHWVPSYKAQVLLIDNSDSANGLSAAFVRFGMILWATPPENWASTYYYDDWLRLLVIHEYTHFLNMDITSGYANVGRTIFGDAFLPNSLWAPWMLEGLAVYMETRFTSAGRGRSPYYEMILRAAVEDDVLGTTQFITLDKVTGTNPYFPDGDTRYQFGYHLMNEVSQNAKPGISFDEDSYYKTPDEVFGVISERSSHRIPFFINDNLKNILGKDWEDLWEEWIVKTRKRMQTQLEVIRSQPVTQFHLLTERSRKNSNEVIGSAASPDGKWLAYTMSSTNRRMGLYLRNLETGTTRLIDDKMNGIGMQFTPDSKSLIYSEFRRKGIYYLHSDLHIYSLDQKHTKPLTYHLRARDPDVSRDGKWVTFTLTENSTTGLALAPLTQEGGEYQIGLIQKIYIPTELGRVSTPKFSQDGLKIYFSLHTNGKSQEDLMEYQIANKKVEVTFSDGKYNRFPAVDPSGNLYFVSNETGVDNLFRFRGRNQKPELVTNMTTGISFPMFRPTPGSPLYASVFSSSGWDLAEVELLKKPISPQDITIAPPPAPPIDQKSSTQPSQNSRNQTVSTQTSSKQVFADHSDYAEEDYSIFPSIFPRAWTPLVGFDRHGINIGGEVLGFDATNRHRYIAAGSYSTQYQTSEGFALYSNRSLGPTLNFSASLLTRPVSSDLNNFLFWRDFRLSPQIEFPIIWTYSTLTPAFGINAERSYGYLTNTNTSENDLLAITPTAISINQTLSFGNEVYSNLGIGAEGGRFTQVGARVYLLPTDSVWKGFFLDRENIPILGHTVLSPSFKSTWSSRMSPTFPNANAVLSGRTPSSLTNAFAGDNVNQLMIRGYPGYAYYSRFASVAALDLRFPIGRIFRGWGTFPGFLDNLYGFTFAEGSYLRNETTGSILPSAGGGLRLSGEFLSVARSTLSVEYHHGFNENLRGANDLFVQIFFQSGSF